MSPHAVHELAAAAQLALSLALCGACAWLARSRAQWMAACEAYRARAGRGRKPALTQVLPALPDAGDALPRFRLTHLDGRVDPDGVARPPGLPTC